MGIEHVICASPSYLARHAAPTIPEDLSAHSCIALGENPSDARWKFLRDGKAVSVEVRGRYTANNTRVHLDAVLHGIGIGSLPRFTALDALTRGDIVQVMPEWRFVTSIRAPYGCCTPRHAMYLPNCASSWIT